MRFVQLYVTKIVKNSKNCNNEINLPQNHNTNTNCNYCSLDLEIIYSDWSECDNNQKTRTKEYLNNYRESPWGKTQRDGFGHPS